ncbi:hypothetical protein DFAR_960003 [Desulfarculales bacterium]
MDEGQKKRGAISRFGVISDFLPGTAWSVVNGRGCCGISAPSGGRSFSPTAPGCRAPSSWDVSGSTVKVAAGWNPSTLWAGMTGATAGPWTRTPPRPRVRLRKKLPTASVTILISEVMRRRLTSLDVILKAPTVYRFLHQQGLMGK